MTGSLIFLRELLEEGRGENLLDGFSFFKATLVRQEAVDWNQLKPQIYDPTNSNSFLYANQTTTRLQL